MHVALKTPEILSIICNCLLQNKVAGFSKLALTCRWFLEPALNALWSDLPGLAPLLKCLPDDAWKETMNRRSKTLVRRCSTQAMFKLFLLIVLQSLLRLLEPRDWERILHHAPRVRSLCARGSAIDVRHLH
ncbi:hypothetical protein BD626DRAFT_54017 [Schizophyllum amplum]|uniref:F-box domain-containing protein n=1 Tax=Schizophyllum amplum TaxID=97359 RepID=A0A550CDA9_9AGAR|nr:hypothetical protein BD626DRAFT_54017 [Auriculariopsis ampla]